MNPLLTMEIESHLHNGTFMKVKPHFVSRELKITTEKETEGHWTLKYTNTMGLLKFLNKVY